MKITARINGQVGSFASERQAVIRGIGIGDRHRIEVAGTTADADRGKLVTCIRQIDCLSGRKGHQIGVSGNNHGTGLDNVAVRKYRQGTVGTTGEVQHAAGIHRQGVGIATHVHGVSVGNAGGREATGTSTQQLHRVEIVSAIVQRRSDVGVIRGQRGGARHNQRACLRDWAARGHIQRVVGAGRQDDTPCRIYRQDVSCAANANTIGIGHSYRGKAGARVHQRHGTEIIGGGAQVRGDGRKCAQRGDTGNGQRATLGNVAIGLDIQGGIGATSQVQCAAIGARSQRTGITPDDQASAVTQGGRSEAAGSAKHDIVEVIGSVRQRHGNRVGIGIQIGLPGNNDRVQTGRVANIASCGDIQTAGVNIAERYAAAAGEIDGVVRVQRDTGQIDQTSGIKSDDTGATGINREAVTTRIGDAAITAKRRNAVSGKGDRVVQCQSDVVRVQEFNLAGLQHDRRASRINHIDTDGFRYAAISKVNCRHIAIQSAARIDDLQHFRIQQQGTDRAVSRRQIDIAVEAQILLAGYLSKAAITAIGTTGCTETAVEAGDFISPDDNATTIAIIDGIGRQGCVTDEGAGCVTHVCIATLIVTADQNLAATVNTGGIDHGTVINTNLTAEHLHAAALTSLIAGGGKDAA